MQRTPLSSLTLASTMALFGLLTSAAQAQYTTYSSAITGFVPNSAQAAGAPGANYLAAQGTPTEFLSFSTDKNGNSLVTGQVNGNVFSNNVLFASLVSATIGGTNSAFVSQGNGNSSSSEIGPSSNFNGILNVNFLADGNTVSAVGFGEVDPVTVRVYDANNTLQATYATDPATFSFFGITQKLGGPSIGRLELDGASFAIQDLQFKVGSSQAPSTPEPGSIALLSGFAISGGVFLKRRKK